METHCPTIVLLLGAALVITGLFGRFDILDLDALKDPANRKFAIVLGLLGVVLMIVSRL